ncbi:restriction endonuclease subunit S [Roseburia inulinivorans]|uniref:restriction endonuclease subunit S n=1 Tax=Roseburia inulinivorans TaxID=360807 RepID=UPI0032BF9B21
MKVKLEDVCERGTSNLKQSDIAKTSGDYPIYGASGYIGNTNFYHQEKPYVAVVKDGAGVGRAALYPANSSVIGTMQYLLPKDNVLPKYLFYVVSYMHLEKYFTGATIPHIYFKDYKNEEFNLDLLERQAEIVEILEKCEKIIEKRKQEIQLLDQLIKARFVEMFGHQSHNEKSLPYMTVDDVAEIYLGITHTPTYVDSGVMFISAKNTSGDFLDLTDVKYISREEFEGAPKGSKPQVNDVLFSRVGSNLGHPVILEEELELCTFVSLGFLRSKGIVTSNYLKHWMRDEFFAKQVSEHVKGGGQPNLNTGWLKEFKIIVPNLEKQKEFDDFCHQVTKSKLFEFSSLQNHTGMLQ